MVSCSSSQYADNQKMKAMINKLEVSEIILEAETDSSGNILDTISIAFLKYDNENRKRYREKKYYGEYGSMLGKDYFNTEEDLFYRETYNDKDELEAIFETKTNKKGTVVKALQIIKDKEQYDTITLDYAQELYGNGKVKKLLIKTVHEEIGELFSSVHYDEFEKALFEVMIMDNDTLSFQDWEYADTILQKSTYTNYQLDTSRTVYYFGQEKRLTKEEEFGFKDGNYIKLKEINHFYKALNKRKKSIEINVETKEKKYIKYLSLDDFAW